MGDNKIKNIPVNYDKNANYSGFQQALINILEHRTVLRFVYLMSKHRVQNGEQDYFH